MTKRGEPIDDRGGPGPDPAEAGRLTDYDLHLFHEGSHAGLHRKLGAIPDVEGRRRGLRFAVWVPDAAAVAVTGDFNGWDPASHPLSLLHGASGIWSGFVPGAAAGTRYRYRVIGPDGEPLPEQTDPLSFVWTGPGGEASVSGWPECPGRLPDRGTPGERPLAVYQVHLDRWRRVPEESNRPLTYRELADWLPDHVREAGFTHVELLRAPPGAVPGTAGIRSASFAAPPGGRGGPEDFCHLVRRLHEAGVGVLLHCALPPEGVGRPEVRSLLLSAAAAWLECFGVDGIRVELPPGGLADPAAALFARRLGEELVRRFPGAVAVLGGGAQAPSDLPPGFTLLWRGDWAGRTLQYLGLDPIRRSGQHHLLVENARTALGSPSLLPLAPPGGGSLAGSFPGDGWQRLAQLRLLLGYAWAHPGRKLLAMGGEFGQWAPWAPDGSLDWHLLDEERHRQVLRWVAHLNILYRGEPALHGFEGGGEGFAWVDREDRDQSVISFLRFGSDPARPLLAVCNFTPVVRANYRVGVPHGGFWEEALNSDAREYGGGGQGNFGGVEATPVPRHGYYHSLSITLPPLAVLLFRASPPGPAGVSP